MRRRQRGGVRFWSLFSLIRVLGKCILLVLISSLVSGYVTSFSRWQLTVQTSVTPVLHISAVAHLPATLRRPVYMFCDTPLSIFIYLFIHTHRHSGTPWFPSWAIARAGVQAHGGTRVMAQKELVGQDWSPALGPDSKLLLRLRSWQPHHYSGSPFLELPCELITEMTILIPASTPFWLTLAMAADVPISFRLH